MLCLFTKIIFKLAMDISMRKIILEVEYFIKKYDLSNVKIFSSRDDPKTFILLYKDTKNIG